MKLDLNIDNSFKLGIQEVELTKEPNGLALLFAGFITSIANNKYSNDKGTTLAGLKLRSFGRLIDKLETAKTNEVELEKADIDILSDLFMADDVKVMPQAARLYIFYRNRIEKLITENK